MLYVIFVLDKKNRFVILHRHCIWNYRFYDHNHHQYKMVAIIIDNHQIFLHLNTKTTVISSTSLDNNNNNKNYEENKKKKHKYLTMVTDHREWPKKNIRKSFMMFDFCQATGWCYFSMVFLSINTYLQYTWKRFRHWAWPETATTTTTITKTAAQKLKFSIFSLPSS